MTNIEQAISNLYSISSVLEKHANDPKHFNSEYGYHLEQMAWSMHRQANDLKSLDISWV